MGVLPPISAGVKSKPAARFDSPFQQAVPFRNNNLVPFDGGWEGNNLLRFRTQFGVCPR